MRIAFAAMLLVLAGCGSTRDTTSHDQTQTVEHVDGDLVLTIPIAGVPVPVPAHLSITRTVATEKNGTAHETRKVDMPDLEPLLAAVGKLAAGGGLGIGPQGIAVGVSGVAAALAAAFGAHQRARANTEAKRADTHAANEDQVYEDFKKAVATTQGNA